MRIELRRARAGDASAIAEIADGALPEGWSAESFRAELEARGGVGFVALGEGDALLGYVLAARAADEVEIRSLAVAAAQRRCGIARRLLAALLEGERAAGARKVYLEVRRSNAAALGLYAGAGFDRRGERGSYYADGESAILMAVRL